MKASLLILVFSLFVLNSYSQNQNTCNCCTENHMAFDFWEGKWEVTNPNGSRAGANTLQKTQDGCVLQENWVSNTPGYTGTSYSFYNAKTGQWEQLWVDNQGQSLHLKGTKKGNQMILQTEPEKNKDGIEFYHQVTWTDNPDGTVRQYWETFTEGNDEPTVAFDGLYKKAN